MRRLVLAALLLAAAGTGAPAQIKIEAQPGDRPAVIQPQPFPGANFGPQPRTVQIDGEDIVSEVQVTRFVPKVVEQKVKIGDREEVRKVTMFVPETVMEKQKTALKDAKAFGADGKPLDADALKKRLAKPTVVLVTPFPTPPTAEWQKVLRDDAVILVLPGPRVGFPPPPPPPDIKPPQPDKPPAP
jgi:hypothetical protein